MHPYYDSTHFEPGELVIVKENDCPPSPDNPDGKAIAAWSDNMSTAGCIPAGQSIVIFGRPKGYVQGDNRQTMFVEVLSPQLGRVWVRACDLKKTT